MLARIAFTCSVFFFVARPVQTADLPSNGHLPLPPEQWQSFDIAFHPAAIQGRRMLQNAQMTVFHNGAMIHTDVQMSIPSTQQFASERYLDTGPIILQNHWCKVRFRNIWLVR